MTAVSPRWYTLLLLPLVLLPALATEADEKEIARLIKQLGSDDFDQREEATKRLETIGEPALDALRKATTTDDPEVCWRAKDLFKVIERKLSSPLRFWKAHEGGVWSLAISNDGKSLLSAGGDNRLRLWDVESGIQTREFDGHTSCVVGVALLADGKRAVSVGWDYTARVWDLEAGNELRRFERHRAHPNAIALMPTGSWVLSAGDDGFLRVWDADSATEKCAGETPGAQWSIAATKHGPRAATGGNSGVIHLWHAETGRELRQWQAHAKDVKGLSFSPDGKHLLSASWDHEVRLWEVATGKQLRTFEGHTAYVNCVAFSPDGKRVVSGGSDKILRLWEVETGKELRRYEGHAGTIKTVAFFPDGRTIASGGQDRKICLWAVPK